MAFFFNLFSYWIQCQWDQDLVEFPSLIYSLQIIQMTKEFACPCTVAHVIAEDWMIVSYWLNALSVRDHAKCKVKVYLRTLWIGFSNGQSQGVFIFQVHLYGGLKGHRHILNAVKFKRCGSLHRHKYAFYNHLLSSLVFWQLSWRFWEFPMKQHFS